MRAALSLAGTLLCAAGVAGLLTMAALLPFQMLPIPAVGQPRWLSTETSGELLAQPRSVSEPSPTPGPTIEPLEPLDAAGRAGSIGTVDLDAAGSVPRPSAPLTPAASKAAGKSSPPTPTAVPPTPTPIPDLPITRLELPAIGIEAEVVVSRLVEVAGGATWEVPAFKVGHAERTPGAGAPGNAVLLGHVTSRNAGNVFQELHRTQVGDPVRVFSGERLFAYRVVEVRAVHRTDVSVLAPTDQPSITLITCTGRWLPALRDYEERLVVRGELVEDAVSAADDLSDARGKER